MKPIWFILILLSLASLSIAQTHPRVREIFFNLPLDESWENNYKILSTDKRFYATEDARKGKLLSYINSFSGWSTDQGIIEAPADSIEVELTWGTIALPLKRKRTKPVMQVILKTRYYYASKDSVEKEYEQLLNVLRPLIKDTLIKGT